MNLQFRAGLLGTFAFIPNLFCTVMADYKVLTSDFVNLHVTTSKNDVSFNEKRFPKDITISDLKVELPHAVLFI